MSASPPAGWYRHPGDPTLMRYWDGQAWTGHTAPTGTVAAAQPVKSRGKWSTPALVIATTVGTLAVLGALAGIGVAVLGDGDDSAPSDPEVAETSQGGIWDASDDEACQLAAEEAVRVSGEAPAQQVVLLKVRDPQMVEDNRETVEPPLAGAKQALILRCRGTGVWSDGDTQTEVMIRIVIDADEDIFIGYDPIQ